MEENEMSVLGDPYERLLSYIDQPAPPANPYERQLSCLPPLTTGDMSASRPDTDPPTRLLAPLPNARPTVTSFSSVSTARRRSEAAARLLVEQVDTSEQLQELVNMLPKTQLLQRLCDPVPDRNAQIVAHLASDAQCNPILKTSLARSFAKVDSISKRDLAGTFQISRYSLTLPPERPPKSEFRNGDRYYTQPEITYATDWIEDRLVALNDMSDRAQRKIGDGTVEYHQKYQDFVGPTQMHRDFVYDHRDHPRLHGISRKRLTSAYPWYKCTGHPENCVCHIHYGAAIRIVDYHRNSPGFHRAYAAQFSVSGPLRSTITCTTCKDHPFNGPKRVPGNPTERLRVVQHTTEALRVLLCPNANVPGPQASVACCQGQCPKCGWKNKVQRCPAEWSDVGSFSWREVVYEEIPGGRKRYIVKKIHGTPRQQMEGLELSLAKVLPIHDFLARWQAWAMREIPRQMPETHYMSLADYIIMHILRSLREMLSSAMCTI
jgi:hypothetical protein